VWQRSRRAKSTILREILNAYGRQGGKTLRVLTKYSIDMTNTL